MRIYPVTSSIIIRESEERTDARLLYKDNPLANPYRNFFNEPYILKSYPLIQGVIEDLNFHVVIQKEGNIKITEQYRTLPISVKVVSPDDVVPASFIFEVIDENTFACLDLEEKAADRNTFNFGDTINCKSNTLVVKKEGDVSRIRGDRYIVNILNPERVASSYIARLKVDWALQGASVVDLSINGPIPSKEIDFLTKLIENYQEYDLNKKNQAAERSIRFIDGQLNVIGDSLAFFERQLQRFKKQNVLTDLSDETVRLYQEIEQLEKQKVDLQVSESYYQYLEKYLQEGRDMDQVILPSSI
ncbi:MAG TPA: capsular biosynthesis protein, partial [Cyclobacteriaceae bacterium]|nr:capsular biosynthesis protein [Cyclobacteriaceae bacterium]